MIRGLRPLVASLAVAAALAACSSKKDAYVERPVHEIYNEAVDALESGNYRQAAKMFDEVERQHPYSTWATKAKLMSAYAYYEANDYDEAVIGLDRFIQLHPGNRDVAYAYYLKALSQYERISDIVRDQLTTEKSLESLQEVVRRFPDSKYARDARLKIDLTRDHLAGKEMEVGRYYLRRAHHLAAINRVRRVVDEFQTTSHVQEALHRLVEAYSALGLTVEAQKAAAVLGHNYPGSDWYADSYAIATGIDVREAKESDKGMVARVWNWIF